MTVTLKTPDEIEKMRIAGRLAADVLEMICLLYTSDAADE